MTEPFIGEIRMFCGNFAPTGYAQCNGQLMAISQNTALFSILGTTYGGDGKSNFGLPNLQGSAPLGAGQGPGLTLRDLGEIGGEQAVTLNTTEMPSHSHPLMATTDAPDKPDPEGGKLAEPNFNAYAGSGNVQLAGVGATGNGQPHNNLHPYQVVTFLIALSGVFPPRS